MDIDDEDDFYAPEGAPNGNGSEEPKNFSPQPAQPEIKPEQDMEDLEEGEEQDEGEDEGSDSVR
jgi:hypothetical protein